VSHFQAPLPIGVENITEGVLVKEQSLSSSSDLLDDDSGSLDTSLTSSEGSDDTSLSLLDDLSDSGGSGGELGGMMIPFQLSGQADSGMTVMPSMEFDLSAIEESDTSFLLEEPDW
jgi:hypothetical protein